MSQKPPIDASNQVNLADRLRGLAADGREVDVAQFQFVGFDEIARAYGERWNQQRERVKDVAHAFIKRRLGENDLLVRASDGFVIVYGDNEGDAARAHAEDVKSDLNVFYLGEGATRPPAQVAVNHARLPVQELIHSIGALEFSTASAKQSADEQLAEIVLKYQPAWDTQREAVMKFFTMPILKETGQRVPGYQYDMDCERDYDYLAIDEMVLNQSELALRTMVRDGEQSLLAVSLHYSSLRKTATRGRLCSVMERFNRDLLKYRVIHISGAPPGCPGIYLQEIYTALKQRVPKVAFSLPWNERDLRTVLSLSPHAVGFTLSPWALGENATVSQHELCAYAKQAVDAAHASKARFFFDGHADAAMVARLREIGVDVVSSPAVWPPVDAPQGAKRWPSDLLAA